LIGIDIYEIRIQANAHVIRLVASDLEVSNVTAAYSPFVVPN